MVAVRGLTKAFAGVHALSDVSFGLRSGEVHALLGENGAGKSTLVKCISGVVVPDQGEGLPERGVWFQPHDPGRVPSRQGVGVVFQELPLIPDLSVMENIYFNRQPLSPVGTVLRRRMRAKTEVLFSEAARLAGDRPHQARAGSVGGGAPVRRHRKGIGRRRPGGRRWPVLDEARRRR